MVVVKTVCIRSVIVASRIVLIKVISIVDMVMKRAIRKATNMCRNITSDMVISMLDIRTRCTGLTAIVTGMSIM